MGFFDFLKGKKKQQDDGSLTMDDRLQDRTGYAAEPAEAEGATEEHEEVSEEAGADDAGSDSDFDSDSGSSD